MQIDSLEAAIALTKKFKTSPSTEDLLRLYGLYKQATEGDNETERPGGFDFKAAAKYNSWDSFKGTSKEDAENQYIKLVEALVTKHI